MKSHRLYFVIGASGAGKTTALEKIKKIDLANLYIHNFDSIRVPSLKEMELEYGSDEEWQRAKTKEWIARMKDMTGDIVLDAQTRPSFIDEACAREKVQDYEIILLDCSDEKRKERLSDRQQPELAHERMMSWAQYLRDACVGNECKTIDNTNLTIDQTVDALLSALDRGR